MMWESGPWKLELIRMVERCERRFVEMGRLRNQTWWEDAVRTMQIEKAVFLSAFIVRKLADSSRLSVQAEDAVVEVDAFPLREVGVVPDSMSWDDLGRFYDLYASKCEVVPLRHLINWIIHSYVFIVDVQSDHAGSELVSGFYCNSDRLRGDWIVRVSWPDYRHVLHNVANDEVVEMITIRDGRGREFQLRSATRITAEQRTAFYARHAGFVEEAVTRLRRTQ